MFNLALALSFAGRGFHVFPLYKSPNTERPWIEPKGWNRFENGLPSDGRVALEPGEICASTDQQIISTWTKNSSVIGYGVCAPFHVVFDLDVKNGKDGVAEFTRLKLKYAIPNPALIVKTKSGGLHLYYERDKDFVTARVNKAVDLEVDGEKYPGIDLIANSGYVVGPSEEGPLDKWTEGSYLLIKGNPAEPLSPCPVDVFRRQIRSGVDTRVQAKPTTADELITNSWQSEDEELTATIRVGKVPNKIPTGKRDSLLTSFIGVLKARRLPKDTVRILCERFIDNCELAPGETKEAFVKSVGLEGKLSRFYASLGDASDPRVVARELVDVGKAFKLVDQLHGAMAIIAMQENPYLTPRVVYTETKARQDLSPFARVIPDSDSKRPVNPFDLLIRDSAMPKVHSTGYKPVNALSYVDHADGMERVNMYVPPSIPIGATKRSNIVALYKDLAMEVCGADMADFYLDFMAHLVQKPSIKMSVAMLIISQVHGSGKNTLIQVMKPLIGPKNYLPLSGLVPLVEDKSIILEGNILVVFNEVHRPSNRNAWSDMSKAINKLKTAITESSTQINPKYEKQRTITTFSNFVLLSNDQTPFDLEPGDRRIAVINNNPPKLDQSRFSLVADFAHNEKNGRLSPREYEDMTFELYEFLATRQIAHNLSTGDAPIGRAKIAMIGALEPPMVKALREYRESEGAGCTSPLTCEDKLSYVLRIVLGFKEFGRNRERYDIWDQFVQSGIVRRLHWSTNTSRARVMTELPNMRDRDDYPLVARPLPSQIPQRIFVWGDQHSNFEFLAAVMIRENIWADVSALCQSPKGRGDVLSMVK